MKFSFVFVLIYEMRPVTTTTAPWGLLLTSYILITFGLIVLITKPGTPRLNNRGNRNSEATTTRIGTMNTYLAAQLSNVSYPFYQNNFTDRLLHNIKWQRNPH